MRCWNECSAGTSAVLECVRCWNECSAGTNLVLERIWCWNHSGTETTIHSSHDSSPCRSTFRPSVFSNRIYKDSPFSASKILLPSFQIPLKRKDPPSKPSIYIITSKNITPMAQEESAPTTERKGVRLEQRKGTRKSSTRTCPQPCCAAKSPGQDAHIR